MELRGGMIFYDENRLTDIKSLDGSRPWRRVGTQGDPHGVVFGWSPQTSTQMMVQEEGMFGQDLQDLSGVAAYHLGGHEPGVPTATGMMAITSEGNVKQDVMAKNIAATVVIPVLKFFTAAALKFMSPQEIATTIGVMTPVNLRALVAHDYDIAVEAGASAGTKEARIRAINQAMQPLGMLANVAPQAAIPAIMELTVDLLQLLGQGDTGRYMQAVLMGMGQGGSPAGAQMAAGPNQENEAAMAQQGRTRSVEETRRLPVGRG